MRRRNDPTYRSWLHMKERCTNPNARQWRWYGARGIRVCARWATSFEAFCADMGPRPEGLTLDRINGDGNYEPGNCRWISRAGQQANRRNSISIVIDGEKLTLSEACKRHGRTYAAVYGRIREGMPVAQALVAERRYKFTPERLQEYAAMRLAGATNKQCAVRFGLTERAMEAWGTRWRRSRSAA